ncbi:MAG: hypothetical protein ACRDRL_19470 [Sciscionella sp.]
MSDHTTTVTGNRAAALRAFSILNGLVLLGVLLQALWAGAFMGHLGGADWVTVHQITAYVVVILALVTALVAVSALRRSSAAIAGWSVGLLVLLIIQTGLGQAISDGHQRILTVAHVPVALLIMALGVYLSVAGAKLRRER